MARTKIALIGAGMIGGTLAHICPAKELGDIVLVDMMGGVAKGKGLDLSKRLPSMAWTPRSPAPASLEYSAIEGADVCIVTAGVPRKPGMSRDDLIGINLKVMEQVGAGIKQHAPNAFVICITNPLDAMVWALQKFSGLPTNKVIGMAGVLNSARFCLLPVRKGRRLDRGREGVDAGRPWRRHGADGALLDHRRRAAARLRQARHVHARRNSTRWSSARAGAAARSWPCWNRLGLLCAGRVGGRDGQVLPQGQEARAAVRGLFKGEYGVKDLYVGVPVVIGAEGVEKIIDLDLNEDEKAMFAKSVASVKGLVEACGKLAGAGRPNGKCVITTSRTR